jgi:hypothetical protein
MMQTEYSKVSLTAKNLGNRGLKAALCLSLFMVAWGGPVFVDGSDAQVYAQEEKEDKKAPMKGRKTQALGKKVYEAITEANELVDKEDYAGARQVLDKVKSMPKLTPYETAQLYSFYGFLYFNSEQYSQAVQAYETVLKQPELPEGLQRQTYKTLAQLMFVTEKYSRAIEIANEYMAAAGEDPEMYALIGTAYYQMEQNSKIIEPVEKAISLAKERDISPKEQWWLLLRVAYWEKEDFRKVREILETLVVGWPKKEYWTQLSGIYYELKDEPRQLAAYEAAFDQGLLERSAELVQMAQLFMQAEVPFKGAKVLEMGIADGSIEKNERNLRLLSQAWQLAQEDRKAVGPLQEAAKLSDDGDLYARLATSYLNLSEYKNCIDASRKGIDKGGLKYPGNTWLVLGMCQFESKALKSAKSSFQSAAKFEKSAKNARSWITYVDNEQARVNQLQESLENLRRAQAEAAERS